MSAFTRHTKSGLIIADFTGFEAELLRSLAASIVELLRNEAAQPRDEQDPLEALLDFSGPTNEPEDPVLARLFPTAYAEDDEAAAEFRRFTEGTLRDGKARDAAFVIDTLEEAGLPRELTTEGLHIDVELDQEGAESWMRAFNDIRLVLGTALGVEEDDEAYWDSLPDDEPEKQTHDLYEWMGHLQESLVEVLAGF